MLKNLLQHILDIIETLFKQEEVWVFLFLVLLGGALVLVLPVKYIIWLLLPFLIFAVLFSLTRSLWLFWRQEMYKEKHFKCILLELRIPRQIKKTPEAMEQVLAAINSLKNEPGDIAEKYWHGEIVRWFALEIVSFGSEVHFYIRLYARQKNLVEAALFSYYPDLEVVEVEDYAKNFPQDVPELYRRGMDLWGTEMILRREEAYPIKTYPHFEAEVEERENDPISTFLEVLTKITPKEVVAIQLLISPIPVVAKYVKTDERWPEKWEELVGKLKEPKLKEAKTEAESSAFARFIPRSPVETEVLEEVEKNLSKPAFNTLVRFLYLSPKETFYDSFARRGLVGSFRQYTSLHLNTFDQNYGMSTRTLIWHWPHLFPGWRNEYKKQRLLWNYIRRESPPETWMGRFMTSYLLNFNFSSRRFQLNVEGVATIFHPPSSIVLTEPHLKHLESRRMGPAAGLPIFGEEEELEKYK